MTYRLAAVDATRGEVGRKDKDPELRPRRSRLPGARGERPATTLIQAVVDHGPPTSSRIRSRYPEKCSTCRAQKVLILRSYSGRAVLSPRLFHSHPTAIKIAAAVSAMTHSM